MAEERKHELAELAHSFGPTLREWIAVRRSDLVKQLVSTESPEIRGRIKELDYLLELPERIEQEILMLASPQEEDVLGT